VGGKNGRWPSPEEAEARPVLRLKREQDYEELGADYFDRLNADAIRPSLVRRLERLGHRLILEPLLKSA